jgi:hypothetical protein
LPDIIAQNANLVSLYFFIGLLWVLKVNFRVFMVGRGQNEIRKRLFPMNTFRSYLNKISVLLIALPVSLIYANAANAVAATGISAGTSNLSLKVAGGIVTVGGGVATAGITKESWLGTLGGILIAGGGVALGITDPPAATFYSGTFYFHYDSKLMKVLNFGWLGSWGENPSLLAPPVDPNLWDGVSGEGTTVALQNPNQSLSVNIIDDDINGLQTVSFDWGTNGYSADSTEPFNFFATAFEFKRDVILKYLGDFAQPPSEANFYVSTPGIQCTLPPDETIIQTCGEPITSYYIVSQVPEPTSILGLFSLGILGAGATIKRQVKRNHSIEKETTKIG